MQNLEVFGVEFFIACQAQLKDGGASPYMRYNYF